MPLSATWRELVSGQRRSPAATTARATLSLLSGPYAALVGVRNHLYDRRLRHIEKLDRPVLCIGNLTVGGTGKTPLAGWLAGHLAGRGFRVAVLTRGYKGVAGQSDEARCLRQALPGIEVVVDADRVRGGREAIDKFNAQILILDDGFQHRRLARDLDVVVIDATCPFGNGRLLPGGLLREPIRALARAHAVVISRTDLVGADELARVADRVATVLNPAGRTDKPVVYAEHRPAGLVGVDGQQIGLERLRGAAVAAFCGIGNPEAFFATLERLGAQLVQKKVFTDHHHYTERDVEELSDWASQAQAALVVTTEKDWVKLERLPGTAKETSLCRLQVAMALEQGAEQLEATIDNVLRQYGLA